MPDTADDLVGLLSLQFCSLISMPWPPSRALVMRKCAVVFVYWASLSGCSSSHCLNINRSKIISSLGVVLLSDTSIQCVGQPRALCTIYMSLAPRRHPITGEYTPLVIAVIRQAKIPDDSFSLMSDVGHNGTSVCFFFTVLIVNTNKNYLWLRRHVFEVETECVWWQL